MTGQLAYAAVSPRFELRRLRWHTRLYECRVREWSVPRIQLIRFCLFTFSEPLLHCFSALKLRPSNVWCLMQCITVLTIYPPFQAIECLYRLLPIDDGLAHSRRFGTNVG